MRGGGGGRGGESGGGYKKSCKPFADKNRARENKGNKRNASHLKLVDEILCEEFTLKKEGLEMPFPSSQKMVH